MGEVIQVRCKVCRQASKVSMVKKRRVCLMEVVFLPGTPDWDIPCINTDKPSPGTLLRVHPETDYIETDKPSPGTLLRVHQETDYTETDKPSLGTLLRVHPETDYIEADKPSPGTLLRVHQETDPSRDRDTWNTPGSRLHREISAKSNTIVTSLCRLYFNFSWFVYCACVDWYGTCRRLHDTQAELCAQSLEVPRDLMIS